MKNNYDYVYMKSYIVVGCKIFKYEINIYTVEFGV